MNASAPPRAMRLFHGDVAGQRAHRRSRRYYGTGRARAAPPDVAKRVGLSGRVGRGPRPCGGPASPGHLDPAKQSTCAFVLGEAETVDAARATGTEVPRGRWRLAAVIWPRQRPYGRRLGAVVVRTPDPAIDLLVNDWLLYQVLSCRVWGRSAFYQSGGAYGFRDQIRGCARAPSHAAGHHPRASPARRGAAVSGGRRAALVAPRDG